MEQNICTQCGTACATKMKYCTNCGFELPKIETPTAQVKSEHSSNLFNKKKISGILVGALAFVLSYFAVQLLFFPKDALDKDIMNVASEINKTCPIVIDSETRLDNTLALPDNTFQYNYTLLNIELSNADTAGLRSYLKENIINQAKTNPQMQYQRDHDWILNYYYKDKNGMFLILIVVKPEMYK